MRSNAQQDDGVQSASGERGRPRRGSLAQSDLADRSDLGLQRTRIRRTITASVFATILGVGIVALVANPSDYFPLIPIAVIVLGGINCVISTSGVLRIIGEQRMRRALASTPVSGRTFDQTNGVVDLGSDPEPAGPNDEQDRARRLSSMHAAGIAYGNGTR